MFAAMESKAQHALPQERKRAKGETNNATQVQKPTPSESPPSIRSGAPSPTPKPKSNSGERAFYYPNDKALYGTRWGHGL
jgi:hypothetical protein